MFEIELVSFVDLKVADDFGHYSREEKEKVTLDELLSVANAIREVCTSKRVTITWRRHLIL